MATEMEILRAAVAYLAKSNELGGGMMGNHYFQSNHIPAIRRALEAAEQERKEVRDFLEDE
jgi:hypothetical protein